MTMTKIKLQASTKSELLRTIKELRQLYGKNLGMTTSPIKEKWLADGIWLAYFEVRRD